MQPLLLTRAWDASGSMGDDDDGGGCCCYAEAEAGSSCLHHAITRRLRDREMRLQRTVRLLAAAFVLLATATVALLVTAVLEGRRHAAPYSQALKQTDSTTAGVGDPEHGFNHPSAMLTAPDAINHGGEFLDWESDRGNAFCRGGFSYSKRGLVVPRGGVYRVFLQITFQGSTCTEPLLLNGTVHVIKDSYNVTVPYLASVDTVGCSHEHWRKSLYTAGVFSLEANSRLLVTSTHSRLIVQNEHLMFFGAEFLHP